MFISAAAQLIKKPVFSQIICLGGLGLYFWMSVEVSCPASRQSGHYLPAEALPCCCEVHPVAADSALLLRSPPWATPCGGVSLLYRVASATAGCVSNGRLPQ